MTIIQIIYPPYQPVPFLTIIPYFLKILKVPFENQGKVSSV